MSRDAQLKRVLDSGLVAIIRSPSSDVLVEVAEALVAGGIEVMEVTFTVPNALEVLSAVRKKLGDRILLGAGTVLDTETCRAALLAGAEFIVGPLTREEVVAASEILSTRPPVLALNFLPAEQPAPQRFFQFALSPEDDARAVARFVVDRRN